MTSRLSAGIAVLGWAAATMFHAVVAWSELDGQKPLGFLLYSNGVRYALWTLTLPSLANCVKRFPVPHGDGLRNGALAERGGARAAHFAGLASDPIFDVVSL